MAVKQYAMIQDGTVINVTEMDPLTAVENNMQWDGHQLVQLPDGMEYGIGCTWTQDGGFVKPDSVVVVEVPEVISDRQFFQQLAIMGIITEEEALAAVQTGTLPQQFTDMISQLPSDQQFGAKMLLTGATEFRRDHPVVGVFAAAYGWSDAQTDQFWIDAHAL